MAYAALNFSIRLFIILVVWAWSAGLVQAHDYWGNGKPVPDWVKKSCCGPADAHLLKPGQVHETDDEWIVTVPEEKEPIVIVKMMGKRTPNDAILPSQDGDYWLFYNSSGTCYTNGNPHRCYYCFFVPMEF